MNDSSPLHLFRGVGIELEYMIVARDTLDVLPVADKVLRTAGSSAPLYTGRPAGAGDEEPGSGVRGPGSGGDTPAMNDRAASPQRQARDSIPPAFRDPGSRSPDPDAPAEYPSEVEMGELCWSNELILHVIELKCNGPAPSLDRLPKTFHRDVTRINDILAPMGGCLMSSAAHPWMNPDRDTKLWPHDYGEIYRAFDKVFGCRGHGWSNLQSMHINLPFADDAEFARLHAAIRLVLPIIPALAASSPIIDGRLTGLLDSRLAFYRTNCRRIPSVTGSVIPEAVFTQGDYEEQILQRIYRDIAPHDPDETLRDEWVNARGAIARFCRNTIEIRVIDMQECPSADVAIAATIVAVLKAMVAERWTDLARQRAWAVEPLDSILQATTKAAESAIISDRAYLEAFGFPHAAPCTAGELWHYLVETLEPGTVTPLVKRGPGGVEDEESGSGIRHPGSGIAASGADTHATWGQASPPLASGRVEERNSATVCPSLNEGATKEPPRSAADVLAPLRTILDKGTLARRIIDALGNDTSPAHIIAVYREICRCLADDRLFA